jgi:hypothetical protein
VRHIITGSVVVGVLTGGLAAVFAFEPSSIRAASPGHAVAGVRCPGRADVLPADAVARAADRARIQAPHLYPGLGSAVVTQSNLAPYAGARGSEVRHQCGSRAFHRTVVVGLLFPKELPSASLSQGTVFVSRFASGYRVWEVAH